MAEKNIDAEIKRKHEEFDRDIEAYLNQFRAKESPMVGLSPVIQQLRQLAMSARRPLALKQPQQTLLRSKKIIE